MSKPLVALAILVTACGGGGATGGGGGGGGSPDGGGSDTSCTGEGTGHVIGTENATSIATVASARLTTFLGAPAIILDDTVDSCGSSSIPGGTYLAFLFHAAPAESNYTVSHGSDAQVYALFEHNGGEDIGSASSGFVDVDSATASCVTGTFQVTFSDAATLSGNFGANSCP